MQKLRPIKNEQKRKKFGVTDIETMNWTKFLVIGLYDGQIFTHYKSIKEFLLVVERTDLDIIFAHFGGKFDFLFLLRELVKRSDIKIKSLIPRGSSILSIDIEFESGKSIRFSDSAALLPFSLATITQFFDVENKKQDWDHTKTKGVTPELIEYLKYDCIGLYQSLQKFYEWPLIQQAGQAETIAGQAMRVFRTTLKEEIMPHGKGAQNFARKSYLGGRTEIFRPLYEGSQLFCYDVNSLYPHAMLNEMPMGQAHWVYKFDETKLGIYHANVSVPKMHIPPLGIVREGKFIFPTGIFSGYWTSAELKYARELGVKFEIIEGLTYERSEKIFETYIAALYDIRKKSKPGSVANIAAKLLLNSLYGRFGMDPKKENIIFEPRTGSKSFTDIKIGRHTFGLWKMPVELESFYQVAIASFVTSYARIHMHRIYLDLGQDLFYTDTDSVYTTRELPTSDELGGLKLEATHGPTCFLLPKTYIATGKIPKIAMKGFDKKKIRHFTFDDFKNYLEGDLKMLSIELEPRFATLKTALKQKKFVTMTKATNKTLKSKYSKRTIFRTELNTLSSIPLELNEGKEK